MSTNPPLPPSATSPLTTPAATSSLVASGTPVTSSANQYDSGSSGSSATMHTLSTVMPGFLIAFVCVISIFLACGIAHGRRRRAMLNRQVLPPLPRYPSSYASPRRTKKKKRILVKPKLWEVDVKGVSWDHDLEALDPVAVELQAVPQPALHELAPLYNEKRGLWFIPGLSRPHRPQDETEPTKHAQLAVLLAMPTPGRRPWEPSGAYVLGTASLPYKEDDPEEESEESRAMTTLLRDQSLALV